MLFGQCPHGGGDKLKGASLKETLNFLLEFCTYLILLFPVQDNSSSPLATNIPASRPFVSLLSQKVSHLIELVLVIFFEKSNIRIQLSIHFTML